jgi:histidine triad (HIT) family protein
MASVFSRIFAGEIPCHQVYRSQNVLVFMDIKPLALGHCLVVPKDEVDHYHHLPPETALEVHKVALKVANALQQVTGAKRIGWVIAGFEVAHAHLHLIPCNTMEEMSFQKDRLELEPSVLSELALKIGAALA